MDKYQKRGLKVTFWLGIVFIFAAFTLSTYLGTSVETVLIVLWSAVLSIGSFSLLVSDNGVKK